MAIKRYSATSLLIPQTTAVQSFFSLELTPWQAIIRITTQTPKLLFHTVKFPGLYCFIQNQPSHPIPHHKTVNDHVTATITWVQDIFNIVYEKVYEITHTLFF